MSVRNQGREQIIHFPGVVFERNSEKVGKVGSEKAGNEKVGTRALEVGKEAHRQVENSISRWVGR